MERSEADFTTPNALDTAILQFTAVVLSPPLQEATGEALDDLDGGKLAKLAIPPPLLPRKPKVEHEDRPEETGNRRPLAQVFTSCNTSHWQKTSAYNSIQIGSPIM